MKNLFPIILFLVVSTLPVYAQDTTNITLKKEIEMNFDRLKAPQPTTAKEIVEDEISRKLSANTNYKAIKDSIAIYNFAIKVTVEKELENHLIKEVDSKDVLCRKVWPELNSIFRDIDFGKLNMNNGINEIIIAIYILLMNYNGSSDDPKISLIGIEKKIDALFGKDFNDKKSDYIYLWPITIRMYNRVYD